MKKKPQPRSQPSSRSHDQRTSNACVTEVMPEWEALTDDERFAWDTRARQKRTKGIHYFKHVNLRRLHRGQPILKRPPSPEHRDCQPILRHLIIHNRRGRLRLLLELQRLPAIPTTVWGALPGNRGLARPHHCPRLGWLPRADDGLCDITRLYYAKFGDYLRAHSPQLARQRIFIRTRPEWDDGRPLYEQVHADIPEPEGRSQARKSPNSFE